MKEITSRQDMADIMPDLIEPLKKYYSPKKAWLNLGATSAHYPDASAWMEGFSRPLWGLGSYWADGSGNEEWERICLQGLVSGADPECGEYWGDCVPYDQKLVEMAAISFTLLWSGDRLPGRLTGKQRKKLFSWLSQINRNPCHNCNWRFFHVLVNMALKAAGEEYDETGMRESLDFIDECYTGDGWYGDGINGPADYYIPFGMHFYGLAYAIFMKDDDPERCRRFIDRAMAFGRNFPYWFAENGAAVPYGRSQTYRFAQASFYSACVMAGIEPLPLGVMKGIIVRHLAYWLDKPIFDHDGVLTIGYEYPNLTMAESYNAPGSPYWGLKIFTCLTLPAENAFWKAEALPLPELEKLKVFRFSLKQNSWRRGERTDTPYYSRWDCRQAMSISIWRKNTPSLPIPAGMASASCTRRLPSARPRRTAFCPLRWTGKFLSAAPSAADMSGTGGSYRTGRRSEDFTSAQRSFQPTRAMPENTSSRANMTAQRMIPALRWSREIRCAQSKLSTGTAPRCF